MKKARDTGEILKVKQFILDSALEIIQKDGLGALTMRNLGSKTRMTEPNIYNYFSGKDEIYLTLVGQGFQTLLNVLIEANDENTPPFERARRIIIAYIEFGIYNKALYDAMFSFSNQRYPEYKAASVSKLLDIENNLITEIFHTGLDILRNIIPEGIGDTPQNYNEILIHIWILLHGLISLNNKEINMFVSEMIESEYKSMVDIILQLLFAKNP